MAKQAVGCVELDKMLSKQQWRKADTETWRLICLAAGRDEGDTISVKDLETFPVEVL